MNEITTLAINIIKLLKLLKRFYLKIYLRKKIVPLIRGILFDMYNKNEYTFKRIFKLFLLFTSILNIEYAHLYILKYKKMLSDDNFILVT